MTLELIHAFNAKPSMWVVQHAIPQNVLAVKANQDFFITLPTIHVLPAPSIFKIVKVAYPKLIVSAASTDTP